MPNQRRGPRYTAHLPADISLIEGGAQVGKVSYSQPSRGHCETISKFGMLLSLVGTRFGQEELSQPGRLLFVRVDLPNGPVEAVVAIVTNERIGEGQKRRWLLGVRIQQMSDADTQILGEYLEKRSRRE
ncbi:MAG TPA: PilZ domain-containing protein [Pyrinomonadaceae bacterium]|nr:PilZ domain-containing protein [Pyrinomonadaceae bacterium]